MDQSNVFFRKANKQDLESIAFFQSEMAFSSEGIHLNMDTLRFFQFFFIVRNQIIRVSEHLHADEINLIEVSPQESAAAKARLDSHRKKRRERHASKKAQYK